MAKKIEPPEGGFPISQILPLRGRARAHARTNPTWYISASWHLPDNQQVTTMPWKKTRYQQPLVRRVAYRSTAALGKPSPNKDGVACEARTSCAKRSSVRGESGAAAYAAKKKFYI
mgnify:CR=1 FL=1